MLEGYTPFEKFVIVVGILVIMFWMVVWIF